MLRVASRRGATKVEYALFLSLVTISCLLLVREIGENTGRMYDFGLPGQPMPQGRSDDGGGGGGGGGGNGDGGGSGKLDKGDKGDHGNGRHGNPGGGNSGNDKHVGNAGARTGSRAPS